MRRLHRSLCAALPAPPAPGNLLWQPDYSIAASPLDPNTVYPLTEAQTNIGLVQGHTCHTQQPPFIRGVRQNARLSILTGTSVPGSSSDPYRPAGCMSVTLNPIWNPATDFNVTATQGDPSATSTSVFVSTSDAELLVASSGTYNLSGSSYGDFLTNQNNVSGVLDPLSAALTTGGPITSLPDTTPVAIAKGTSIIVTANDGSGQTQTFITSAAVTAGSTAITINPVTPVYAFPAGSTVTVSPGSEHIMVQTIVVDGNNVPTGELVVTRGVDGGENPISVGDTLKVATGDVNPVGGDFRNRCEVYDRYPGSPLSSGSNPSLWPDPVGSTRWYRLRYFLPNPAGGTGYAAGLFPISSSNYSTNPWWDCTQWKGLNGGSPPRAIGITANGDGTASWHVDHDGAPLYQLGPVTLGQWVQFDVGMQLGTSKATGWTQVYMNGTQVLAQTAAATMDLYKTATDPIYLKQGMYRNNTWTSSHTIYIGPVEVAAARADLS